MKITNDDTSILRRILTYAKPYRIYLIFALICALISVNLSLLSPVLIGEAVDYIIGPHDVNFAKIANILLYLLLAIIFSALFQWLMTFCTNKIAFGTIKDLRTQLNEKLNKVPLKYIDGTSHGNIINSVVNDVEIISDGLLQGFAQLFTGLITILGTIIFMISINLSIAIVVMVLTPLSLFVAAFISSKTHRTFTEQSHIRGELTGYIEEMLGNQKTIKTFNYEKRAINNFKEINDRLYECGVKSQFYSSITNPSTRFVNGIVYVTVGVVGAFFSISGKITIGRLSSFLAYANQYTKPFNEISGVITELQSAFASAKRVFSIIDEEVEISDEGLIERVDFNGIIEIEDLAFSYNKEQELLEGLNLEVEAGQKIAIVGPTGCGKTTIINLLMRFYDVDKGSIKVSGVDINKMKRSTLRKMYGMVLQETWLFNGTVWDNIAYGKEGASKEEIIEAAKAAHADGFIQRLPEGYDTVLSGEGGNISQGQKQLLCIARVMLTKPPMLILDEATSNIDTRTEIRIQKAFAKLMEGRTSFIVAHRLSTIKESDIILVMKDGQIIEQGNHEYLLLKKGFYADLYNSQFAVV
ncbi:MAG TPA: ABC transporter ATP-binding protein [Clostridiales bacterium]|nr:ABC transporter ATP-binding protein [Clostridiales bacterium]